MTDFFIKEEELNNFTTPPIQMNFNHSMVVSGCEESEMIILALWKTKKIQQERKGTYQLIVLSKLLKEYISKIAEQIGLNQNFIDYLWSWKSTKRSPTFDYIIILEAHHFLIEDILLLKEKSKKAIFIFGNSVVPFDINNFATHTSMSEIASITAFPIEQLFFYHRLPKKIARVAQYLNSINDDLESRCKNEGVELPKILKYDSINAQLDAIAEIITNRNFEDVAILFRYKKEIEFAYCYLSSKGIVLETNVEIERRISFGKKYIPPKRMNFGSSNPKLLTYHSVNWLSFEAVFLPQCRTEEVNLLHNAITRTSQSLYITHSGDLSPLFEKIPVSLYKTTLTEN